MDLFCGLGFPLTSAMANDSILLRQMAHLERQLNAWKLCSPDEAPKQDPHRQVTTDLSYLRKVTFWI
jgi:hypothetical protein